MAITTNVRSSSKHNNSQCTGTFIKCLSKIIVI